MKMNAVKAIEFRERFNEFVEKNFTEEDLKIVFKNNIGSGVTMDGDTPIMNIWHNGPNKGDSHLKKRGLKTFTFENLTARIDFDERDKARLL